MVESNDPFQIYHYLITLESENNDQVTTMPIQEVPVPKIESKPINPIIRKNFKTPSLLVKKFKPAIDEKKDFVTKEVVLNTEQSINI